MTTLSLTQLRAAGRDLAPGFSIALPTGDVLTAQQVLRILPGKRIVFRTQYQGKDCAAKLFLSDTPGSEAVRRETEGYDCLQACAIATPALEATHALTGGATVLLYSFVAGPSLQEAWDVADAHSKQQLLRDVYAMIAKGHDHSVMQEDLHPGNFLLTTNGLCMLDPGLVYPVAAHRTDLLRDNLAMLVAQFPRADHALALTMLDSYFALRQQPPGFTTANVTAEVAAAWQQRRKQFLQKIFRDCSYNLHVAEPGRVINCVRAAYTPAVAALLRDLDGAIAAGRILKDGTSSTVAVVRVEGREYVCKRYHNTSRWVAFRRSFLPGRAHNSWYYAHLLQLLGIRTPTPVAMLECRRSRCDHSSYFISEYIAAGNAYDVFTRDGATPQHVATIAATMRTMAEEGVVHGDCKTTNWLVANDKVWLVDLDSMHENLRSARSTEDVLRFMADWHAHPALRTAFAAALDIALEANA